MTGALGSKCIRRVFARLFLGSMDLNRALYPGGAHERTEVQARHEQLYGHTDLRKLELDATKHECTAMYCLHWYEFVGNQPFVEMYAFETTMRVGELFTNGVLLLSSTNDSNRCMRRHEEDYRKWKAQSGIFGTAPFPEAYPHWALYETYWYPNRVLGNWAFMSRPDLEVCGIANNGESLGRMHKIMAESFPTVNYLLYPGHFGIKQIIRWCFQATEWEEVFVGGSQQRMGTLDKYSRLIVAVRYEQMYRKHAPWYLPSIERNPYRWPASTDWFLCDQTEPWGQRDQVWAEDMIPMRSIDVFRARMRGTIAVCVLFDRVRLFQSCWQKKKNLVAGILDIVSLGISCLVWRCT